MNYNEACQILEVDENISDDLLKKKYKELAKKHHPDVSKDENTFKKINEAYQLIIDYKQNPQKYQAQPEQSGFWNNVVDLGEVFFGGSFSRKNNNKPRVGNIVYKLDISFAESVMGCTKEISYSRNLKCDQCNGEGVKYQGNGCNQCDGFGRVISANRGVVFQTSCSKCSGKDVKHNDCSKCSNQGTIEENRNGHINIPAGATDGTVLRLPGHGHYAGASIFGDNFKDVNIQINVSKHPSMTLIGADVHTNCTIDLLTALEGKKLEIETVYGKREISVPTKSKNKDKILIENCGVKELNGNHIVTLEVMYPENIESLVGVLKNAIPN